MLSLQLERSAEAPLSFNLFKKIEHESDKVVVLKVLLPVMHRWQDISLGVSDVRYFSRNGGYDPVSLPQLTKLSLFATSYEHPFGAVFQSVPLLKELHYDGPAAGRPMGDSRNSLPQLRRLPLSQIKKFHLSNQMWSQVADVLDVLRAAFNIVEASFHRCYMLSNNALLNYPSFTNPNLASLEINDSEGTFLSFIIVPALRRLSLEFRHSSIPRKVVSFLALTGSSLTHLTLCLLTTDEKLRDLLGFTPHITNLVLEDPESEPALDFVTLLTYGPGKQNLVPELVFLDLLGCFQCGRDPLLGMLKSRCAPGSLRHLRLDGRASDLPDDIHIILRNFMLN
jgi:hypothetical protein